MRKEAGQLVRQLLGEAEEKPDGWIGVDLDGTLARYTGWKGSTHIGSPIPRMVERVRRWVSHGKKVKIFTARADDEKSVNAIKKWLKDNELPDLEITNLKDQHMEVCYDDRAIHVHKNTGKIREALQHPSEEEVREAVQIITTSRTWQEANAKLEPYGIQFTADHEILNQTGAGGGVWGDKMLLNARYFGKKPRSWWTVLLAHELTHTAQMKAVKARGGDPEAVTAGIEKHIMTPQGGVDMEKYTRVPLELQALARNAVDTSHERGHDPKELARSGELARHSPIYPGDKKRFGKYAYQLMQQRKRLGESGDSPMYPYKAVERSVTRVVWEFKTDEGVTVEVTATQMELDRDYPKRGGAVRVDFESDLGPDRSLKTTTVLRVYKTILMGIVADIIKRNDPEVLYFMSGTMSRANIAHRFLKVYEKQGWTIKRTGEFMTMTSAKTSRQAHQALDVAHSDVPTRWHRAAALSLDDFSTLGRAHGPRHDARETTADFLKRIGARPAAFSGIGERLVRKEPLKS